MFKSPVATHASSGDASSGARKANLACQYLLPLPPFSTGSVVRHILAPLDVPESSRLSHGKYHSVVLLMEDALVFIDISFT